MSPRCTDARGLVDRVWELTGADLCTADARDAMRELGHSRYELLDDDDIRAVADYVENELVREDDLRDAERDRA